METPVSFAPLAARLAAQAAKIRPVDGARNDWDKIGALIVCLVLEMLICLCEALDARAAAEAGPVAVSASRNRKAGSFQVPPGEKRAPTGFGARGPSYKPDAGRCSVRDHEMPRAHRPLAGMVARPWPDPGRARSPWRPGRETKAFAPAIKHAYIIAIS